MDCDVKQSKCHKCGTILCSLRDRGSLTDPPPPSPPPSPLPKVEEIEVLANDVMMLAKKIKYEKWMAGSFSSTASDDIREALHILAGLCENPLITPSQFTPGKCLNKMYVIMF